MNMAKINYVAVGIFITTAIVGIIVSMALLTGHTGRTDSYYSVYANVTGVKFGTQVLYEGYPIGQVEKVTPVVQNGAMRFRVDYAVTEGWQIPDDSVARIGASGLLSAITINIDAGASPIAHKPGAEIHGQEASDLFAVMSKMAGEVSSIAENDIRPLLKTINATADTFATTVETVGLLVEEDGVDMIRTFSEVASDLSVLTQELNDRLPRIAQNVDASAANFAALSADLQKTRARLDTLLSTSDAILGENRAEVKKSIEDLKHVTDSLARHIDAVNQNVEGTARNMYEFSREIRQNPGLLLSGTAPKKPAQ